MTSKKKGTPSTESTAFRAALKMYSLGPQTKESILLLANFGNTPARQADNFKRSMASGWLAEVAGAIHLSDYARHYFDGTEPEAPPKPTGSLATPREVKPFRPMSPQYRVNSRGNRPGAMDNSQAAMPSHFAKVNS